MMPHVFGAICGLLLPDESWHCPRGDKIQAPCLLVGPRWPGLRPRVPAWLGPITGLWWRGGWALPVTQIWIRCPRWYKTNPGLVVFGSSSGKKSAHSVDSSGRLTSHFGHITDLMRDKWSGARSSRCLCRLAWQTWLLHRFICLWFSHHSGRGQGWTHTENRSLFFWSVSKITVVFKSLRAFWCHFRESSLNQTCWNSCFHQQTKPRVQLLRSHHPPLVQFNIQRSDTTMFLTTFLPERRWLSTILLPSALSSILRSLLTKTGHNKSVPGKSVHLFTSSCYRANKLADSARKRPWSHLLKAPECEAAFMNMRAAHPVLLHVLRRARKLNSESFTMPFPGWCGVSELSDT